MYIFGILDDFGLLYCEINSILEENEARFKHLNSEANSVVTINLGNTAQNIAGLRVKFRKIETSAAINQITRYSSKFFVRLHLYIH